MSTEDTTINEALQLPHPTNRLEVDVLRLRNALTAADQRMHELGQEIAGLNTALQGISKASLGLGNVDNTADTEKPVSTPQQQAINTRMPLAGGAFTGGISFGNLVGASNTDLSKHVSLHSAGYGFSITGNRLNFNVPEAAAHCFIVDATDRLTVNATGAAVAGNLTASGTFTSSNNVTAYSDIRLKIDLQAITSALDKVQQLTGYTYTRTDNGERQTGLIAQDVQKVLPEAVVETEGGTLALAYGNLMGLIVQAVKELRAQVQAIKDQR